MTDNDDREARIAELERQLAEAKAAAGQYQGADDGGRGMALVHSAVDGNAAVSAAAPPTHPCVAPQTS